MGKSVEKACNAPTVSEETMSVSELKVECENQVIVEMRHLHVEGLSSLSDEAITL